MCDCIINPFFLGCVSTCGQNPIIPTGLVATEGGLHKFKFQAGALKVTKMQQIAIGQNIEIPTFYLNENMYYLCEILTPSGVSVTNGLNDGWAFRTEFETIIL